MKIVVLSSMKVGMGIYISEYYGILGLTSS
jgi:hypothetical protein